MDVRQHENFRESWYVKNLTDKNINIGDLPLVPTLKPDKQIDILKYYTKEKIGHSKLIPLLLKNGKISFIKKKIYDDVDSNVHIDSSNIEKAITSAEENEVGSGNVVDDGQYTLTDGSRPFTNPVSGVTPEDPNHLVTKEYVDSLSISGIHNDLDGLQGGTSINPSVTEEYYHLNYNEYIYLVGGPNYFADSFHSHSVNIDGGFPYSEYGGVISSFDGGDPFSF